MKEFFKPTFGKVLSSVGLVLLAFAYFAGVFAAAWGGTDPSVVENIIVSLSIAPLLYTADILGDDDLAFMSGLVVLFFYYYIWISLATFLVIKMKNKMQNHE